MTFYKIKINCTSKNDLCFDNKKINKTQYNKINYVLKPNIYEYIDSIIILNKKHIENGFITKTIEFLCNKELSENEFSNFIEKLKCCSFNSKNDTLIQVINIKTNDIVFNYKFNTGIATKEVRKNKKNKSIYFVEKLYNKST
jgi:hypothetical protein